MDVLPTMASKCISNFSQWASPGAPPIIVEYHVQTHWLYVYIPSDLDTSYMPCHMVAKLVTVTKTNMIYEIPCGY